MANGAHTSYSNNFSELIKKFVLPFSAPQITNGEKNAKDICEETEQETISFIKYDSNQHNELIIEELLRKQLNGQQISNTLLNSSELIQKISSKVQMLRTALIVVDFQNDFVHGSLSIKAGEARQDPDEAVEPLNGLLSRFKNFQKIVYTMDWHPSNHISFMDHCHDSDRKLCSDNASTEKFNLGDIVNFENPSLKQSLYPSHCVKGSWGAEIYSKLVRVQGAKYIRKGITPFSESYSGFVDNMGENRTDLEDFLRQNGIQALFICGLALDVCVAWTARDAVKLGFLTAVIRDCSKGLSNNGIKHTEEGLSELGVAMMTSAEVHQFLDQRKIPLQWCARLLTSHIDNGGIK